MDGLALLCNLFADGPVTLERLRSAGMADLEDLARVAPGELAGWLHASVPQARAFALEARKLEGRIGGARATRARTAVAPASAPAPRPVEAPRTTAPPPRPAPARPASAPLRAGLAPGLDEFVCARLAEHGVHTVERLVESAGLSLARRTGIPYSRLLELARATPAELREHELVPTPPPLSARSRAPQSVPEPVRSDEFTLPLPVEPDVAGPFV